MSRSLGLGARLGLGAAALVLMTAGVVAWGVVDSVVGDLHRALELRGRAVARDLAADVADPLVQGDFRGIEGVLVRVWDENDLARVEVRDLRGVVVAARAFPAPPIDEAVVTTPITGAPDADGFRDSLGTVRVVLSGAGNGARRLRYLRSAARYAGATAVLGVVLAGLLAWVQVRPLRRLQVIAQSMRAGAYDGRAPETGAREIAELSALVNEAMDAIAARETELQTAYTQLQTAEQAREAMTHMLVHDLKGPISNVLMLLDVIEDDADPEDVALLAQGRVRCQRLLEMIEDLLVIARLERAAPDLERAAIALPDLLADAVADVQHIAHRQGINIEINAEPAVVRVDVRLVRRALVNLLLNALKHGAPPITVEAEVRAETIRFTVEDGGAGVPDALRATLFEPFRQGAKAKGGAGLGLAFVRLAARAHGGTARVDGARFDVELPRMMTDDEV